MDERNCANCVHRIPLEGRLYCRAFCQLTEEPEGMVCCDAPFDEACELWVPEP